MTGGFKARITSPGSFFLLHDKKPSTEEAWELSFDLSAETNWPPGAVLGFAINDRSDQDFRVFAVHGNTRVSCTPTSSRASGRTWSGCPLLRALFQPDAWALRSNATDRYGCASMANDWRVSPPNLISTGAAVDSCWNCPNTPSIRSKRNSPSAMPACPRANLRGESLGPIARVEPTQQTARGAAGMVPLTNVGCLPQHPRVEALVHESVLSTGVPHTRRLQGTTFTDTGQPNAHIRFSTLHPTVAFTSSTCLEREVAGELGRTAPYLRGPWARMAEAHLPL